MRWLNTALLGGALCIGAGVTSLSAFADNPDPSPSSGLVLFLTQSDPMVASHGLHIASRMLDEDRQVTIMLIGEAGQIAVKDAATGASRFTGESLQQDLAAFIAAGGTVAITPPTVASLGGDYGVLIEGVGPPKDHQGLHDHMFEPRTKLMVF
ncbi:MAG: hypothetical protein AAF494_07380 [Pseudomonadota bacterium]